MYRCVIALRAKSGPPTQNKQTNRETEGAGVGLLQEQRLFPLGAGGAVGLCRAAGLALRCHLHVDGGAEEALLPLDLGAGHCGVRG